MKPPELTSPSASSTSTGANGSGIGNGLGHGLGGGSGAPAGYGRSCTNCSRAKCKCILRPGNASSGACERCHRLGKECNPIIASRKRVEKKHSSSRTAQLEEKLDDLVSILRSSQGGGAAAAAAAAASGGSGAQHARSGFTQHHDPGARQTHNLGQSQPTSRLDSLATAATAGHHGEYTPNSTNLNANYNESDENSEPTPAEAELYLQKFRGWLRNFPFMHIPPETTAAGLREEKPFLWICIMNLTSMSVPQMQILKTRVRQHLAETVVMKHEPSLDIIQGLLAYLGWATMNSGPGWKPFLILFVSMAQSTMYELGLTRSPVEEQYFATCFRAWGGRQPQPKPRTTDERRCLLSLWFLSSIISSFIGKVEALRWTFHMEESLELLEREKEHPSDETLTSLVRIQIMGDEAHKLLVQDIMKGETAGHTPSFVFQKSMINRLKTLRDNMPPSASATYIVQAHGYATEVLIYSMGLFRTTMPETQRIDSLYSCLQATRNWYDIWFSIPLAEVPSLPFAFFTQLLGNQLALYRLTTTEDPAWDKDLLRSSADLLVILDRTIERLESVSTVYPLKTTDEDGTLYTKAVKIMRNVKANWEPVLTQNLGGLPTPNSQAAVAGGAVSRGPGSMHNDAMQMSSTMGPLGPGPVDPGYVDPMNMDFTDLAWMTDVFGPWEF